MLCSNVYDGKVAALFQDSRVANVSMLMVEVIVQEEGHRRIAIPLNVPLGCSL